MSKLRVLRKEKASLVDATTALNAKLDTELSEDEAATVQASIEANFASIDRINASIAREERLAEERRAMDGIAIEDEPEITGGDPAVKKDPKGGFAHFGEFARSVYLASQPGAAVDERLRIMGATPSTYSNEGTGADGGFLVPPEFSQSIYTLSLDDESFIPMTDNTPVGGNSMVFPKDETTPWGSDGVRGYWENEVAAATATKGKLSTSMMRLKKLFALVPVSDELLEDSSALASYLPRKAGESIRWKANDAIINGDGSGQPLGLINGGALVTVAKETSQTADTVNVNNVAKMYARMPAASLRKAVWIVNNDVFPQLITMVLNNQPIYTPPGRLSDAPFGTLLGRPILISQHCQTLGTAGDIQFVDFSQYRTITKRGGIETATSMHLYFDSGATAFRSIFRIDGQPSLASPIVPANGSNNLSPFVVLATRA